MADARRYILQKRSVAISDLSALQVAVGDVKASDPNEAFRVNGPVMVGIGTSVEVGLEAVRYPYVVEIVSVREFMRRRDGGSGSPSKKAAKGGDSDWEELSDAAKNDKAETLADITDTVTMVGYLPLVDAAGNALPFSQRSSEEAIIAGKIVKKYPQLTDAAFVFASAMLSKKAKVTPMDLGNADVVRLSQAIVASASLATPSAEINAAGSAAVDQLCAMMTTRNAVPHVQVSENVMIRLTPFGSTSSVLGEDGKFYGASSRTQHEYMGTLFVNALQMSNRYVDEDGEPTAKQSLVKICAAAIAQAHVQGVLEVGTKKEFNTILCTIAQPGILHIRAVKMRSQAEPVFFPGKPLVIEEARTTKLELDLAAAMVFNAGLMHYQYNHSTGGELLSGPALSTLSIYNLFDRTDAMPAVRGALAATSSITGKSQTSLCYEALHPVGKRAIANLFFQDSGVLTWGRRTTGMLMRRFETDAFITLRAAPRPAGSHKAYLSMLAMQRVMESHLAVFLPWAGEINTLVASASRVLRGGARAHIGSHYYTGEPPVVQSSDLDKYMPDLAAFIQTMSSGDTLAMSPHLSLEVAARASTVWQGILRQCRGIDYSTVPMDKIQAFLKVSGKSTLVFDSGNPDTWQSTIDTLSSSKEGVSKALGM